MSSLKDKPFKGKTLAILSGGGDTPAINSSIEMVRNRASVLGFKVYGIRRGWAGLLGQGDVADISGVPYNGWYGGTALRSSRTNPFPTKKNPKNRVSQILDNLKRYQIDALVTIGGDDTNGAAKKLYETEKIPVIGFPKTIDNDLRTKTMHSYGGEDIEAVLCPGFATAAGVVSDLTFRIKTNCESHVRIMVVEVMGRDAGWLTGSAIAGGATLALVPEVEMTRERKERFMEKVKEAYENSPEKALVIAVSEGVRWHDDKKGKCDVVYASSELDEFGHPRFGGISGTIASEIKQKTGIDAKGQITGYFARGGICGEYDRQLTSALADKVADLLLREEYGQMPVMSRITDFEGLEEYNTASIDMGHIGNRSLPDVYYDSDTFRFTPAYEDFLGTIMGDISVPEFPTGIFKKIKP